MNIGSDCIVSSGAVIKKISLWAKTKSGYCHYNPQQLPLPPNKPLCIKLFAYTCVSIMLLPGEVYETVLRFSANVRPHRNSILWYCWFWNSDIMHTVYGIINYNLLWFSVEGCFGGVLWGVLFWFSACKSLGFYQKTVYFFDLHFARWFR